MFPSYFQIWFHCEEIVEDKRNCQNCRVASLTLKELAVAINIASGEEKY
jgi:hypothetical protein